VRFFVDTNVLVYRLTESEYREPCARILDAIVDERAEGVTSTAVLEELWHLELRGVLSGLSGATQEAFVFLAPLLAVTHDVFREALELPASSLGANDRLHAATCRTNGIDAIVSADAAFDELGVPRRIDPLDATAVGELLA
jgi:hypothetical protein